jgi:hypothetical protein
MNINNLAKFFFLFHFIFIWTGTFAQSKFTLSGKITDALTGEDLIGATILIKGTSIGIATNMYGFFSLTLPKAEYEMQVRYLGYNPCRFTIQLNADVTHNIALEPESQTIDEVVVNAEKRNENLVNPLMGIDKLNMKQVDKLPVLMGEKDILKTIQCCRVYRRHQKAALV